MTKIRHATRMALLLGLLLTATAQAQSPGQEAPDFTLMDKSGAVVHLSDFRGQPVVLNAWATWCPFCIEEIPLFQRAHDDINSGDEQVVFLLVNLAERFDQAQSYIDDVVATSLRTAYDATPEAQAAHSGIEFDSTQTVLTRNYRLRGMPTTYFIDADGVIQSVRIGPIGQSELVEHLAGIGVDWQP